MRSQVKRPRVVKYGGSVLRDADGVARAAEHAAGIARTDVPLVVVVSALFGRTEELLARGADYAGGPISLGETATDLLTAVGELEAVAAFTLALGRLGVAARPLSPHELGLRTVRGKDDDGARVFDVERSRLLRKLRIGRVLVVPGFLGTTADFGRITTLGRGGSDLTAVALAEAAGARTAEFVKDVPGLFDVDPRTDARAIHLPHATYAEARALVRGGARCLMPRAVEEAERRGIRLQLCALNDPRSTTVGPTEGE